MDINFIPQNTSQNSLPALPFINSAENCEEPPILTNRDAYYRDYDHNTDGLHNASDISANGEMSNLYLFSDHCIGVYRRSYGMTGQRGIQPFSLFLIV